MKIKQNDQTTTINCLFSMRRTCVCSANLFGFCFYFVFVCFLEPIFFNRRIYASIKFHIVNVNKRNDHDYPKWSSTLWKNDELVFILFSLRTGNTNFIRYSNNMGPQSKLTTSNFDCIAFQWISMNKLIICKNVNPFCAC